MTAIDTTSTDPTAPPTGPAGGAAGGDARARLVRMLNGYSRSQKITAAVVVVAVVAGVFMVSKLTGGTEYAPLFTDVSAEDGSAIVASLEEEGVAYELSGDGSTILVPADKVGELRMKLAGTALPSDSKVGYGVLDGQGLTTSEFSQKVGFQRAMEGELGATIESLDVVDTAVVHLALPDDQAFAADDEKASASVLIKTSSGQSLSEDQVRAVVNLVASGIEGLSPDDVTVADSDGNVLAAPGQGVTGAAGVGTRQRQTDQFESRVEASLSELLQDVVGQNGAKVTVAATLDFDETNLSRETFEEPAPGTDGNPLRLEESTRDETYTGGNPTVGGVLGPDTPATANTTDASDYSLEEADVRYALNRVVESTNEAPGAIERLSIAVAVDQSKVSAAEANALAPLLSAGAGIEPERGDVLTVSRTPFDDTAEKQAEAELKAAEEAEAAEARNQLIRNVATALLLLLLMVAAFFIYRRSTRSRRLRELQEFLEVDDPAALPPATPALAAASQADAADVVDLSTDAAPDAVATTPAPAAVGAAPETRPVLAALDLTPQEVTPQDQMRLTRQSAVSELIDHQPDEVAALLRSWLGDRRTGRR